MSTVKERIEAFMAIYPETKVIAVCKNCTWIVAVPTMADGEHLSKLHDVLCQGRSS